MRRTWLIIAAAVVVVSGAVALVVARRQKTAAPETRAQAALTLPAESGFSITGVIRPQHVVTVGAATEGLIQEFLADVGAEVMEGQPLAHISSTTVEGERQKAETAVQHAQERLSRAEDAFNNARLEESRAAAELSRARTAMDRASQTYDRQKLLFSKGAQSKRVFDKATEDFEAVQLEFEQADKTSAAARTMLQNATKTLDAARSEVEERAATLQAFEQGLNSNEVLAPANGIVVARHGDVGKPANEFGDQMFIIATNAFELEVPVEPPPPVLSKTHPGTKAVVVVTESGNNVPIQGEVKSVDGGIVVVQFVTPVTSIRPGMKADVRFALN